MVSSINFDQITMNFNNSDTSRGGDRRMILETGIFTAVTRGHCIIPLTSKARVRPGEYTNMWLYQVKFSLFQTFSDVRDSGDFIRDHSSRTKESSEFASNQLLSLRFYICWLVTHWIQGPTTIVIRFTAYPKENTLEPLHC